MGYICTEMGFSYEENPFFVIFLRCEKCLFPSLLYNITQRCNKPVLSVMFPFAKREQRESGK